MSSNERGREGERHTQRGTESQKERLLGRLETITLTESVQSSTVRKYDMKERFPCLSVCLETGSHLARLGS